MIRLRKCQWYFFRLQAKSGVCPNLAAWWWHELFHVCSVTTSAAGKKILEPQKLRLKFDGRCPKRLLGRTKWSSRIGLQKGLIQRWSQKVQYSEWCFTILARTKGLHYNALLTDDSGWQQLFQQGAPELYLCKCVQSLGFAWTYNTFLGGSRSYS